MEIEEIENDEWYAITMEHDGKKFYLDQNGAQYDKPSWIKNAFATISGCKALFNELKGVLPKDAEYDIVKIEDIFRVSYVINLEL